MQLDEETLKLYKSMKYKAIEFMKLTYIDHIHLYRLPIQSLRYDKGDGFSLSKKGTIVYWKRGKRKSGVKFTIENLIEAYENYGIIITKEKAVKTVLEILKKEIKKRIN